MEELALHELTKIRELLEKLTADVTKPKNRVISFLEIFAAVVGALGIIDIVKNLFGG